MAEFLFVEFCNHVYLGQWELARACAFNLIKSDTCSDEIKRKLISTIQSLSKDPYLASSAWSSLPCPSYVNLLSCCLLFDLCYKDGEECKDYIDFNILLEMTLGSPENILKELTCIFDEVTKIKRSLISTNSYPNFEITNECVTALKNSFKENPSQVSLLLKKLCLPEQMKFSLNTVFCNMFIQLILNSLKSAESLFSKKENATFMKNLVHKIYLLLSLLPDFITDRDVEQIFLYCIELAETNVLKLDKIYSSLLGCSSSRLLKYFCKLEDNISGNKESKEVKFKVLKSNYITTEGNFHHRKALLWSLYNNSHFLNSVMECYVENILNGNWESIKGEICDLPSELKSLFLLLSWEKCTDDVSSMNVIKAMKMWNESVEDPVIQAACKKFQLNISLSEMCISNYKSLFPLSESVEVQSQLWRILTSLQTQSLLRVLHTIFGLKNIPCARLENMLKESQEHPCNADLNLSSVLTDESIYYGYIVMVLIMEAIYLSCEFKDALESKQINLSTILYKIITKSSGEKSDTTDECKTSETVSLSTYMSKHGCQEAYSKFIVEKLEAARQKIKNLFPLSFRVEILENIFSMLFLMVKNLVDLTEPSYDSDQGHEEESQLFDKDDSFSTYSVETPEMKFVNRFIISTTKLKNSVMLKNDASENVSGHISSKSTESTGSNSYQPHTFLCNELITRDLLSLLKDSVLEAKAEIYKKIGWKDPNQMEDSSTKKVSFQSETKLSDNYNGLPERTSRLLQYVNEAIWRHEVVQRDIFQKRISLIDRHKNKPHFLQSQCSTSSSEGTDKEIKKHRKRKKHKYSSSQKDESVAESSIIQCMLSSPEALLRYSLWNGNLMQAGQVIKLFNLQASDEAKELTLINELQQISNKLIAYDKIKGKSVKKSTSFTDEKSISSSISTIKSAASYGLHSSSLYMTIHQELSSLKVLQVMDITGQVHHPELLLGSENIYSIFLIDLACVSSTSIELASSLLDSADKSWTSVSTGCKDFDVKTQLQKKIPLIKGNSQILHMMNSLLKEFLYFFKENPIQSDIYSIFWPLKKDFQTVPQVLPYFIGNLNHTQFKEEVNNWKNICFLIEEFSTLLDTEERSEQTGAPVKDIKQENKLHMTYKQLSRTLRGLRDWSSVVISSEIINYTDYLSKLFIHLRQVTTAALECKNQTFSAGQTIYSSDFSILKESPVELLKKIILQTGVTPEKIENFAIRMKVDLVRVLAQACLPYVPLLKGSISLDKLFRPSCQIQTEGYPKYIMNMSRQDWPKPRHPDLVARELLRDLISMLQETAIANDSNGIFKTEELISLTQHSQLSGWMEECSELAFVDLDLLQTREEKLAFFINVTNVAWLYAILLQTMLGKTQEKEEEENKYPDYTESNNDGKTDYSQVLLLSSNNLERFTVQKLVGFSVGQLGAISLFDLRYQLLRDQLPVPKHLDASPFHKLFCDKNPIWNNYMPILEPRLLFVLVEGLLFSPKLQVVYSEDIDDTLEKAMKDYFDITIHIDVENDSVTLPQLLEWYALDFSKEDENCFDKAPYEGLINLLSTLVRPPLTQSFQELLSEDSAYNFSENIDSSGKKQLPFTLEFRKSPVHLGIMLDYCSLNEIQPNMKPISLMDPQPIIINYLKEKCSILTDLYGIIISENPSQNLLESNHSIPVFNLLQYYHDINVLSNEKFLWFSSALSPSPNRKYFMEQIEFCFSANMWHQSLQFIDIYLEYHGKPEYNLDLARQMILEHISSLNPSTSASEPSNYALCISDPLCRANAVLQNVHKWTEHSALKALKYCLSDSKISDFPDVYLALKTKFREITLYKKIVDASEIYGNSEAKDCVYVFNNWQEVADCSVWDQSRIFDFLNSCEKYDLAVEWLELNVVNSQEKINALSMNLLWYLLQDPPDEKALKILDTLENSECLKLCDMVLPKLSSVDAKLCLVKYLVNNVPAENQQYYYNMFLGLKMLAALKSPVKETYAELVGHPYLILEQMLMNAELKDAEKALTAVIHDLESLSDIVPVMNKLNVNQLVEDYASKALEVHFLDALLDTSSSSTLVLSIEDSMVSDEPFVMPVRVPTKEEWIPDAKIHRCQVCKEEHFNMFTRRHHCRRCGRVVCANCSQHALIVEGYGNVKVRVCEECYNLMTGSISVTSSSFDKRYRVLSSMQSSPRNSPYQENIGPRRRTSSIHQAYRWVLSPDNEQNASVRNEFAYEQAPSISLCFSILKLHCDSKKCAQCMLNLCDRLLGKIKPRRSGKIPVEIDYNLIISMIKSLLMSVKVTCHQIMDSEREALADLYFQHLDFVKLLVNANCRHLLPREALTNTDSVRKLRDKLLEEERMSLALEVSTKFHLDKTGVWSSWGLFCIRAGDLPAARTKFQQCLKVISDKSDPKQESPLLNKILEVLENSKHAGNEKAAAIYKSLSSLKNIEKGTNWLKTESSVMDEMIQKECEYYLSTYGTHFTTVRFYQRNSLTYEALNYIVNKKCEPEIFIEAVFMPMLKNVQLSSLKHNLSTIDPSLSAWWNYLFATCRHLERLKYLNLLYEMQLFMEDYARAAKSAINFYLSPASTYKMLFERHRFLYNAKKHYQKYLRDSKETDAFSLSQKNKNLKILSPKEVERYIEIIILQEEVARFFQQCISQSSQGSFYEIPAENNIAARYCPPTLFGNLQKRTQVTIMVILNAVNIDEGFELAIKIIQIFGLDATAILCEAGKELVKISKKVQIPHFLACVKCFFSNMVKVDQVILECVSEIHKQRGEVEDIIKMLTSDTNKINAYLMCDKLKSAYLLAIKSKSALDVRRVLVTAEQSGQAAIHQICKKWLESNSESKLK